MSAKAAPRPYQIPRTLAEAHERRGKILLEMNGDPHGQALVKTFGLKGFVRPAPGVWDPIEAMLSGSR